MYKQTDIGLEISRLKKLRLCAWTGRHQKYLTVTVEENDEQYLIEYYFRTPNEYSKFIRFLRRLEQDGSS